MVVQYSDQMRCITTQQAIEIAAFLKRARYIAASELLESIGSHEIARQLRETRAERPDATWIYRLAEKLGITVKSPENIEQARRDCCNEQAVSGWFTKFATDLKRDDRLILNCDETHVSSRKRFRVLTPDGHRALKACRDKLPHFSAMCTITPSGYQFRPMFILPELVKMPEELKPFEDDAYFASTGTGWMTQRTFLMYAQFLLYELKLYRQRLPPELMEDRFLLILDGHSSRWTSEAISVLRDGGVDVLVLPAHCTHVLQPFDVSVAAPVKTAFAAICDRLALTLDLDDFHRLINTAEIPGSMAEKRKFVINAFVNAWGRAAVRENIQAGFAKCGIVPFNPDVALDNPYTRKRTVVIRREDLGDSRHYTCDMNCAMVTSDANLFLLRLRPNKVFSQSLEKIETEGRQWRELLAEPVVSGRFLSAPKGCLWYKGGLPEAVPPPPVPALQSVWSPCHWDACHLPNPTHVTVWQITCTIASTLPILFVLETPRLCTSFSRYLERISIQHQVVDRKTDDGPGGAWHNFQVGRTDVCLTTMAAVKQKHFARRILTVYRHVPTPGLLRSTSPANCLIFCQNVQDLTTLRHANIKIGFLPRNRYDPMEMIR
jgi:hypothetical protein